MKLTTLQYLAINQLALNDLSALTNPSIGSVLSSPLSSHMLDGLTNAMINALSGISNWSLIGYQDNTDTGFAGIAIQAPSDDPLYPDDVLFAFRGTEVGPSESLTSAIQDINADATIALPGASLTTPNQFNDAYNFVKGTLESVSGASSMTTSQVSSYISSNDTEFTGYSLGGGLVQSIIYQLGTGNATTFNSVGMGQLLGVTAPHDYDANITDYVNADDIIGNFGVQLGQTIYLAGTMDWTGFDQAAIVSMLSILTSVANGSMSIANALPVLKDAFSGMDAVTKNFILSGGLTSNHNLSQLITNVSMSTDVGSSNFQPTIDQLNSFSTALSYGPIPDLVTGLLSLVTGTTTLLDSANGFGANLTSQINDSVSSISSDVDNLMSTAVSDLTSTITAMNGDFTDLQNIVNSFFESVGSSLSSIISNANTALIADALSASDALSDLFNTLNIVEASKGIATRILAGESITDAIYGQLQDNLGSAIGDMDDISDAVAGIAAVSGAAMLDAAQAITASLTSSLGSAYVSVGSMISSVTNGSSIFANAAANTLASLSSDIGNFGAGLVTDLTNFVPSFTDGIAQVKTGLTNILSAAGDVFAGGIESFVNNQTSTAESIVLFVTGGSSSIVDPADSMYGTSGNDTIHGYSGNNYINADAGNDVVYAGAGNDTIYGQAGNDTIYGESGDDILYGDDNTINSEGYGGYVYNIGNDVLDGGAGNDTLVGDGGDDTYIFGNGYGQDTIIDSLYTGYYYSGTHRNGGNDTIVFNAGVSPDDVLVKRLGSNLVMQIVGSTDSLTVQGFFTRDYNTSNSGLYDAIEQVTFKDTNHTIWSQEDLLQKARYVDGTASDDYLTGYSDQEGYGDIISTGNGNDTVSAGGNDDQVSGGSGDDTLFGGAGNDIILGGSGNDTIYGDDDGVNSEWYAGYINGIGNDTLDGGSGNDTLVGDGGDDTYVFGRGYGQDTIIESLYTNYYYPPVHRNGGNDTISMLSGVDPSDVTVRRSGNNLILKIDGTPDTLTVQGFFTRDNNGSNDGLYDAIEQVVFADANHTVWTQADLLEKARYIDGTSGNDYIYGYPDQADIVSAGSGNDTVTTGAGNDILYGEAGDDILYGDNSTFDGTGNDTLDGGSGNDALYGAGGNDTYVFGLGYGQDTIFDGYRSYNASDSDGGFDTISILPGVDPEDIKVSRLGNNLTFSIVGTTDSITVQNFFSPNNGSIYAIEQVTFADSTVWDYATLLEKARYIDGTLGDDYIYGYNDQSDIIHAGAGNDNIIGGSGNDILYGEAGDDTLYGDSSSTDVFGADTLDGGMGNDMLYGGGGNDTYVFGLGYGQDTIYDQYRSYYGSDSDAGFDIVSILPGVDPADVVVSRSGNNLVLSITGTTDSLTIQSYFTSPYYAIEEVHFADSAQTVWSQTDLAEKARHINGTSGNDAIYGFSNQADIINAGDGNDTVYGSYGADVISGEAGNDVIYGDNQNDSYAYADTLDGGTGNDMLYGGAGNDTYIFGLGYGQDTVFDQAKDYYYGPDINAGFDIVSMLEGVDPSAVTVSRNGNNLILSIDGTTDALTIQSFFSNNGAYAIEEVHFADTAQTIWSKADLIEKAKHINGTSGNDAIYGFSDQADIINAGAGNDVVYGLYGADTISGDAGDDVLYGDNQNDSYAYADTLDGGTGNDMLYGGAGNDTYIFGLGYGQDTIYDQARDYYYGPDTNAGSDTISFLAGVNPNDVTVTRNGSNLVFAINGTTDTLTVQSFFSNNGNYAIEQVVFNDAAATIWTSTDLYEKARHINGTSSADALSGFNDQSNILMGGQGNDTLYGAYSNDTYVFKAGDGSDTIYELGGTDEVDLENSLTNIVFTHSGNDLMITTAVTADSIGVTSWYSDSSHVIETFKAADGSYINSTQVDQLIQAMATFSSNNGGMTWQDALSTNNQDAQSVISQYWTVPSA